VVVSFNNAEQCTPEQLLAPDAPPPAPPLVIPAPGAAPQPLKR
jgi:hypothetical protein